MANQSSRAKKDNEIEVPGYLKFSKVIVWLMYFWVLIGVIALALRVFLLAFSANTAAGFANFVMRVSGDYLQPFRGIFEPGAVGETGYLDVSAIFAIIIYLLIAWGFKALIDYVQDKIEQSKRQQKEERLRANWEATIELEKQREARKRRQAAQKRARTKTTAQVK